MISITSVIILCVSETDGSVRVDVRPAWDLVEHHDPAMPIRKERNSQKGLMGDEEDLAAE